MKTNIDRMEITKMKTLDMTKGSPIRLILQFTVPLLIGAVFQQFYNFTDTMIVGRCLRSEERRVGKECRF